MFAVKQVKDCACRFSPGKKKGLMHGDHWLCMRVCMCLLLHYMPCFTGNRRFSITMVTTYRNSLENYLDVEIGELGQTEAAYNCLYMGLRV